MPIVRCPQCNSQMMVEDRDAGHEVECPVCMAAFIAPKDATPKPATPKEDASRSGLSERSRSVRRRSEDAPRSRRDDDDDDDDDDRPRRRRRRKVTEDEIEDARDIVRGPARGLVLTSWIGLAFHIVVGIALLAHGLYLQQQPNLNKDDEEAAITCIIFGPVCVIVSIPYCICMAIGAHKLLRIENLKSASWPTASAAMAIGTIVLCGLCSPVTWFAMGFGIWMLVAVNNKQVKRVIESNALYSSENGDDAEF